MAGNPIPFGHLKCQEVPSEQMRPEPPPFLQLLDPVPAGFRITFVDLAPAERSNQWVSIAVVQPDQTHQQGDSPLNLGLRKLHSEFIDRVRSMHAEPSGVWATTTIF